MKLWIIYKGDLIISKVIAEMLQDRLESYIDVSVGKVSKIEPSFIVEEELDYLIIIDIINEIMPSLEIQKWVLKYGEIIEGNKFILKAFSGFLISLNEMNKDKNWYEFIKKKIMTETIFPPLHRFKLDKTSLTTENYVQMPVKEYSNDIIEFITNNSN